MSDSFPFSEAPREAITYYQVTYVEGTTKGQWWDYPTEERARHAAEYYQARGHSNVRIFKVTREELTC